ncbi:MAG: hypothetical protein KAT05_05115 [Spirochaetes bacterium]|nr:hypothetical protein [Spirochaetota bacterium]
MRTIRLYSKSDIISVPCVKIKDTWHEADSDTNFCYASATGVGTAVLVGSLVADTLLLIFSAGAAAQIAVGVGAFALSYYATHSTAWPGHNTIFWNS